MGVGTIQSSMNVVCMWIIGLKGLKRNICIYAFELVIEIVAISLFAKACALLFIHPQNDPC